MSTALKKANGFKEIPSKIAMPCLIKTDFFQSPDLYNTKKTSVSSQAIFKMKGKRAGHELYFLFVCLFLDLLATVSEYTVCLRKLTFKHLAMRPHCLLIPVILDARQTPAGGWALKVKKEYRHFPAGLHFDNVLFYVKPGLPP